MKREENATPAGQPPRAKVTLQAPALPPGATSLPPRQVNRLVLPGRATDAPAAPPIEQQIEKQADELAAKVETAVDAMTKRIQQDRDFAPALEAAAQRYFADRERTPLRETCFAVVFARLHGKR